MQPSEHNMQEALKYSLDNICKNPSRIGASKENSTEILELEKTKKNTDLWKLILYTSHT